MTRSRRPSLVEQVRAGLLDDVTAGKLVEGDKLPNEYDLADRFKVSRATVREAILSLLENGYLARFRGTGTFVTAGPPSRHALNTTVSYTAMIREAGREPGERVLATTVRVPTEIERQRLVMAEGARLIEVERIRLGDNRPLIYSRDRIPQALLAGTSPDMLGNSLYVILEWAGHKVEPRDRATEADHGGHEARPTARRQAAHAIAPHRPAGLRLRWSRGDALRRVARGRRLRADRQPIGEHAVGPDVVESPCGRFQWGNRWRDSPGAPVDGAPARFPRGTG